MLGDPTGQEGSKVLTLLIIPFIFFVFYNITSLVSKIWNLGILILETVGNITLF